MESNLRTTNEIINTLYRQQFPGSGVWHAICIYCSGYGARCVRHSAYADWCCMCLADKKVSL